MPKIWTQPVAFGRFHRLIGRDKLIEDTRFRSGAESKCTLDRCYLDDQQGAALGVASNWMFQSFGNNAATASPAVRRTHKVERSEDTVAKLFAYRAG
jgi:hypothetical protein